jgi:hypothetical protein
MQPGLTLGFCNQEACSIISAALGLKISLLIFDVYDVRTL